MNYLINKIGLGHSIAFIIVAIMTLLAVGAKAEMPKRISYAIDYELGIAQQCDGTDKSYEVHGCKYDYSEYMNK